MNTIKRKSFYISLILSIYLSFVTNPVDWHLHHFLLFFIKLIVFTFFINSIFENIPKIKYKKTKEKLRFKDYLFWFILIFSVMLLALFIYYPENFTTDMNNQYNQIVTGKYSDWHPIIHTMVFYRIPTLLIQSKLACSIFQMIFVSIILLYFCSWLNKFGFNRKLITLILCMFIFNPSFDFMAISPLKDVAFSYSIFVMTLFSIFIYLTDGKWLESKLNILLFLLTAFGITFFRHNGIFTIFAVMFLLILLYKNVRKTSLIIFLIILSLRFIIVPFIYSVNKIKKTNVNISEMVCVLVHQMVYIYNNNGNINDEELELLGKFQRLENVEDNYDKYNYNSLKYSMDYHKNYAYIINENSKEFFNLWFSLVKKNLYDAYKAYLYATHCIWNINVGYNMSNNDLYWIAYSGNKDIYDAEYINFQSDYYKFKMSISKFPENLILFNVGTGLFYILLSLGYVFSKLKKGFKNNLKLLFVYMPVLSNVLLMFILLPGRETRFVYSNILCAYPLIIFMLLMNKNKQEQGEVKK